MDPDADPGDPKTYGSYGSAALPLSIGAKHWLGVTASISFSGEYLGSFLAETKEWTEKIGYS
jgi:hypothetical protein